ncbi:hypothetical protein N7G274_004763 [Stereocaulon virgatum]|uniref:Ribosomal protein S7 n=1 Tax=Stereocaulon virgatum TaxID=373712 RepID=A0ABR4A926_9LECA
MDGCTFRPPYLAFSKIRRGTNNPKETAIIRLIGKPRGFGGLSGISVGATQPVKARDNLFATSVIGTVSYLERVMPKSASRNTISDLLETPSRRFTGPTDYINRSYEVVTCLMFFTEFRQRRDAEFIRAAEENTQRFGLIASRVVARLRSQRRGLRQVIPEDTAVHQKSSFATINVIIYCFQWPNQTLP